MADGDSPYHAFGSDPPRDIGRESPTEAISATQQQPELPETWSNSNDVVRDLHRSLLRDPGEGKILSSQSEEGMKLPTPHRLFPEIGTASQLAQPGGFRRAHVVNIDRKGEAHPNTARIRTPLVALLQREGFVQHFVTRAIQQLDDGTQVLYSSRAYRRGALPKIQRSETGEDLTPPMELRFFGFRGRSVPYWASLTFGVGAILFTQGSFYWMALGEQPVPAWAVTYPFFVGGCNFLVGCYLTFVEVINANLSVELLAGSLNPAGSIHRKGGGGGGGVGGGGVGGVGGVSVGGVSSGGGGGGGGGGGKPQGVQRPDEGEACLEFLGRLHWWRFQPSSLLWWGAFVQLVGAVFFQVGLVADLPCVGVSGFANEVVWSYLPSTIGSACFTFASYVYLLEVAEEPSEPWKVPSGVRERLGFYVAMSNLLGSFLFLVASLCYFARVHVDEEDPLWDGTLYEWEYLANVWGVRFIFGLGSACFIVGSALSMPEVLSDAT
jgi:hypothetical protein